MTRQTVRLWRGSSCTPLFLVAFIDLGVYCLHKWQIRAAGGNQLQERVESEEKKC